MIKLIELLDEIKVNNPKDIFQVTELGRKSLDDIFKLEDLINEWGGKKSDLIRDSFFEGSNKYNEIYQLYICSSKYGENIIQDNGINKIEDFKKLYDQKIGDEDGTEAEQMYKAWKEQNWIK